MSKHGRKKESRQPSAQLLEWIESHFDEAELVQACERDSLDFGAYATMTRLPGCDRFYWYQDNGSDILAVAHLDSVQDDVGCQVTWTAAGPLVTCGALDDRLGAYVILDLLPRLGVVCDILLTTDEELGRSTAREFAEDHHAEGKRYNWVIQFDRGGTDVVLYQYETDEYVAMVEEAGAQVGEGSYSCIAELEALGCAAFNWGVGYQDYHSPRSHAWLRDTFRSVARFLRFYEANHATLLPHEPCQDDAWRDWRDWAGWGDDAPDPIEADCGHLVDLADDSTYVEWGADYVICVACEAGMLAAPDVAAE